VSPCCALPRACQAEVCRGGTQRKTTLPGPRTSTPKRGGTTGKQQGEKERGDPKGGKHNGEMIQNEKCHFYKFKKIISIHKFCPQSGLRHSVDHSQGIGMTI